MGASDQMRVNLTDQRGVADSRMSRTSILSGSSRSSMRRRSSASYPAASALQPAGFGNLRNRLRRDAGFCGRVFMAEASWPPR
jgi:hypothetical protein